MQTFYQGLMKNDKDSVEIPIEEENSHKLSKKF